MASNCLALNTKVFFQTTGANQVIVNHHMALRAKQSDAVTASTAAASALAASPLKPGGCLQAARSNLHSRCYK